MSAYIYIYIYIYITQDHIYTCVYTFMCISKHIYIYECVYIYAPLWGVEHSGEGIVAAPSLMPSSS